MKKDDVIAVGNFKSRSREIHLFAEPGSETFKKGKSK